MYNMNHFFRAERFIEAVEAAGINAPDTVVVDGQLHRFSSNGKRGDKSGYYALHSNVNGIVAGVFGCWRSGFEQTWCSKQTASLSLEGKLIVKEASELTRAKAQALAKSRALYAQDLLQKAEAAKSTHPYLTRKGDIPADGIYWMDSIRKSEFFANTQIMGTLNDVLLVPVLGEDGTVVSIQAIAADGSKFFMSGGTTKGGTFTLSGESNVVYVAEGFATAASIHKATGKTVICAFNANNLKVVAPKVVAKFESSKVIVAADNDATKEAEGKGNKGKDVALELFKSDSLPYSMPVFESDEDGTDWNDYACIHGTEGLAIAIAANLVKPQKPTETFEEAIERLREQCDDISAFAEALEHIFVKDTLFQARMKKQLKELTGVPIKDIDSRLRAIENAGKPDEMSHGDIARKLVSKLGTTEMAGAYGSLWTYDSHMGIWESKPLSKLSTEVSSEFNGQMRCQRVSDYKAIAGFVYDLQEASDFFETAPHGVNTPSGFLRIKDGIVVLQEVTALHRARHGLAIDPAPQGAEPMTFLKILHEAFSGCYEEEQIRQLRMAFGLSLFGVMPQLQRAVFLYGAAGSGKSVVLKVLASLLPNDAITSVSPYVFDNEYQLAALAGKRFNFVPEMEKDKPIPSAQFKSIIGGDKVGAREPHGKVFTHTPCAAHWFNGNHLPKTTDHTEGFYRRWYIIHFTNTKPDSERNPGLLDHILAHEMPAILRWAIDGIEDYLTNGLFSSNAHKNCLAQWKREGNSVQGWLSDSDDNGIESRQEGTVTKPLSFTEGYSLYRDWCVRCGVRAYKKSTFVEHMKALGCVESKNCGYRVFSNLSSKVERLLATKIV